jgi:hypothetical protein
MAEHYAVSRIKEKFTIEGNPASIPLIGGGKPFEAKITGDGVYVDNLATLPFLPWAVFTETVALLESQGGRVRKGDAMKYKLGDSGLPLNSVEGHIGHLIYGKQPGETLFRRITPIACILIWAGICQNERGYLVLQDCRKYEGG